MPQDVPLTEGLGRQCGTGHLDACDATDLDEVLPAIATTLSTNEADGQTD